MTPKLAYTLSIIAYVIVVAWMVALFAKMTINRSHAYHENTQNLVTNCILSVTPDSRTHQNIENCYKLIEKQTGQKLERYYINE